jgi:DNA-binding HxlR family transcriptional regulator
MILVVYPASNGQTVTVPVEIEAFDRELPVVGAIKGIVTESRLLVVRHLFTGPKRFNELLRESGINSKPSPQPSDS